MLNDRIYNILKWATLLALPAFGTLYSALATIWGLPFGEEILKTTSAIATFLGAVLGISTVKYNKINKGE